MLTLAALHTSPFEVWGRPQKGALTVYQQPVEGLDGVEVIVSDDVSGIPSKRMCGGSPFSTANGLACDVSNALLTLHGERLSHHDMLLTSGTDHNCSPVKQETVMSKSHLLQRKTDRLASAQLTLEESDATLSFDQWLASITERINQTMHYQFDGNPDPLVFHAPKAMFDCLQERISVGSRKKRLPNHTTGFVRREALPLGMFTKYTWHLLNILHIKKIFDTPIIPLEITRSFVENHDGTFDLCDCPHVDNIGDTLKAKNQTPIRPAELKTFLKVGKTTTDQKEPTPFVIEWIPDILPKTQIGELRIKLEYGHQRNGHLEQRTWIAQQQQLLLPEQRLCVQDIHDTDDSVQC